MNDEVTWEGLFAEGENRIKQRFLDAMVASPARERARMLAQRERVQKLILNAQATQSTSLLRRALREQVLFLSKITRALPEIKNAFAMESINKTTAFSSLSHE